jgi:hypothetical protein
MDITEKYTEGSFAHWLAMFSIHQEDWTIESIMEQISMYRGIEGDDEYHNLREEIKQIISNNDLGPFLAFAKERETIDVGFSDLERMANLILKTE